MPTQQVNDRRHGQIRFVQGLFLKPRCNTRDEIALAAWLGRGLRRIPALEIHATHQHRKLGGQIRGFINRQKITDGVQRLAQKHVCPWLWNFEIIAEFIQPFGKNLRRMIECGDTDCGHETPVA